MIVYIGNMLTKHGVTPTAIDTLGERLAARYPMVRASDKKNQLLRLADMLLTALRRAPRAKLVLIDVYSRRSFYYAWAAAMLCRLLGKPYIPILHGGDLPKRLDRTPRLCRMVFGSAAANVAPSRYIQQAFADRGYAARFIPNAIELGRYAFRLRAKLQPKLLFVRALDRTYNPDMAIHALAQVRADWPEASLTMVGPDRDGSRRRLVDLAKALGLDDAVALTGRLPLDRWLALAAERDIFVNPTNTDNHPVSVTEAMALGLPVVSTNAGGLPWLIEPEHDGLLVEPDAPDQMAAAISRLLRDPELAEALCRNGRRKAERFDWTAVERQWRELIDGFMTDPPHSST